MKERQLQDKVLKYLKDQNIYCIKIYGSGRTAKGAPDILACIDGRFVAFELKVGENDMQPDQRIHRKRILESGGLHYCVRSMDELINIIQANTNTEKKEGESES